MSGRGSHKVAWRSGTWPLLPGVVGEVEASWKKVVLSEAGVVEGAS